MSAAAMLTCLGIDIIEVDRLRRAIARWPRLARRLFTERERAYCERRTDPAPHYAARFAAKEAMAKALGRWLRWQEVEVVTDPRGRPGLALRGEAAELAHTGEGVRLLVSLSHTREYAVACVCLVVPQETEGPAENLFPPGVWA